MKFAHLLLLSFIMVMSSVPVAFSQNHATYCKDVDSTAASQQCLTRHLKEAQSRLNKIYEKLSATLNPEELVDLKDLQKTWLTYRDAECMWESDRTKESVLKRVNELSCMARVTEDRADLLTVAYGDIVNPDVQRQFGNFPRWMNAVAKDYPNVYWKYGTRTKADLNCDNRAEHVMVGMSLDDVSPSTKVIVVENPLIGKPKGTLFSLNPIVENMDGKDDSEDLMTKTIICNKGLDVRLNEGVLDDETKTCGQSLVFTSKECVPLEIKWAGKGFEVALEDDKENETKPEK